VYESNHLTKKSLEIRSSETKLGFERIDFKACEPSYQRVATEIKLNEK